MLWCRYRREWSLGKIFSMHTATSCWTFHWAVIFYEYIVCRIYALDLHMPAKGKLLFSFSTCGWYSNAWQDKQHVLATAIWSPSIKTSGVVWWLLQIRHLMMVGIISLWMWRSPKEESFVVQTSFSIRLENLQSTSIITQMWDARRWIIKPVGFISNPLFYSHSQPEQTQYLGILWAGMMKINNKYMPYLSWYPRWLSLLNSFLSAVQLPFK